MTIGISRNRGNTPKTGEIVMNYPSTATDMDFLNNLQPAERIAFAARCARLALRLLHKLSFPVVASERETMEMAVQLAEETATTSVSSVQLEFAMQEAGRLAFAALTQRRFRTDMVIGHVAHAAYAAARAAITASREHAQDAMDYAFEAVRTAGARDIERSLTEEVRRCRSSVGIPDYDLIAAS
jgi:hypothetical protein